MRIKLAFAAPEPWIVSVATIRLVFVILVLNEAFICPILLSRPKPKSQCINVMVTKLNYGCGNLAELGVVSA